MRLEYSSGWKGKNRTSSTSQMAYNPVSYEFGFRAMLPRSYCSRRLPCVRCGWAKWKSSTLAGICLQSPYITTSLSYIACYLNSGQNYLTAIRRDCSAYNISSISHTRHTMNERAHSFLRIYSKAAMHRMGSSLDDFPQNHTSQSIGTVVCQAICILNFFPTSERF